MEIRPARPGDALDVARVHVRAWQVGYRGLLPDAYLDRLRPEDRAARYTFEVVDPTRPTTLVAVDGGVVLGFATTGPSPDVDGPETGELMALHVDPNHWQRGVGRALVGSARAQLAGQGYREAVLWVLDGNTRGARFYAADGWSPDGTRRTEAVWGVSTENVRYHRALL
jgi:GNAT superfamily N-acetyltransferase